MDGNTNTKIFISHTLSSLSPNVRSSITMFKMFVFLSYNLGLTLFESTQQRRRAARGHCCANVQSGCTPWNPAAERGPFCAHCGFLISPRSDIRRDVLLFRRMLPGCWLLTFWDDDDDEDNGQLSYLRASNRWEKSQKNPILDCIIREREGGPRIHLLAHR